MLQQSYIITDMVEESGFYYQFDKSYLEKKIDGKNILGKELNLLFLEDDLDFNGLLSDLITKGEAKKVNLFFKKGIRSETIDTILALIDKAESVEEIALYYHDSFPMRLVSFKVLFQLSPKEYWKEKFNLRWKPSRSYACIKTLGALFRFESINNLVTEKFTIDF